MIIHANMIPFFALTILIGAAYMAYTYDRMRRANEEALAVTEKAENGPPAATPARFGGNIRRIGVAGALIGAAVGFLGPLIFMVPLQSCTFEAERDPIDQGFGLFLFFLGTALLLVGVKYATQFYLNRDRRSLLTDQTTMGTFKARWWAPLLLLAPTIFILIVFLYYPLIDTFRLSTLLVRLGAPRTIFRCVDNFTELLQPGGFDVVSLALFLGVVIAILAYQPLKNSGGFALRTTLIYGAAVIIGLILLSRIIEEDYAKVLFNTFFISAAIVIFGLGLGLAVAYLAFQPVRGAFIYRTLLVWPYAMSPAIAGIIFFVMFDPVAGVINHIIELLGGQGVDWIRDPWLARFAVIVTSVWKTLGYNVLFYIAGLQTIPSDHVEAASIDGANAWQRFRHIVVPALSPITFFLIVTNLTYAFFNIFGTIDFLTRGGPVGATSVAIYEIYQIGIRSKDLGGAAAQSLVLFIMVIGVTVFQFRTSGSRVTYGA
ncbi:carbohydrate ABC transporter permease [Chloroflexota bacterium]